MKQDKMNWESITLKQFLKLQEIEENNRYSGEELATKRISVIFDCKADILTIPEYMEKAKQCEFLSTPIPTGKAKGKYKINGTIYIPMLNPFQMIMGQYIDFKHILEKPINYPDLLSIVLIPENHTYNDGGYNLQEAKKDFLQLPITDVVALGNFFFRLMKKYQRISRHCLKRIMKQTRMTQATQQTITQIMQTMQEITGTA